MGVWDENNKLLEYIEDLIYFQKHNDSHGFNALRDEGKDKYVSLFDASRAILGIIEDLTDYIDTSQAITELRLKAIVSELPPEIQTNIVKSFIEVGDDLFAEELKEIQKQESEED